ncbi:MAG: DUF1573 domain-containing protein [Syntrophothermus sp.]
MLFSCRSGKNEEISTDIILNPNTAQGKVDPSVLPVIKFENTEHDFGRIIDGETVAYNFKFTNTGKTDLVISEVSTSCGCTVPDYPKEPVRPGQQGNVKVSFNSTGKHGFQSKNIVVVANTQPNTTIVKIRAEVVTAGSQK